MTSPSGSDRRPPLGRSLTEQAMETGMRLLGKVDPKLLASAGSLLLGARSGRGRTSAPRPAPGGIDLSGVARQLGALLAELGALRDQPRRTLTDAPARPAPAPGPALQTAAPPGTLAAEPAVGGTAQGTARVVTGDGVPAGLGAEDVLVCRSVPISWTPVLGSIAGIVFETGGVASAALRACRSAGIPAVRLADATTLIDDGAPIGINGTTGRVRC